MILKTIDGYDFQVDDGLVPYVTMFTWRADKDPLRTAVYIYTSFSGKRVSLHTLIIGFTLSAAGFSVDHIDHDGTNNLVSNLRIANESQNAANRKRKRFVSPYRGVYQNKRTWTASAQHNHKVTRRHGFLTPEAAAKAYDEIAKGIWGEFAVLNFPGDRK